MYITERRKRYNSIYLARSFPYELHRFITLQRPDMKKVRKEKKEKLRVIPPEKHSGALSLLKRPYV